MAWTLTSGSLSSSTSASVSTTFSTSQFRRYSWYCPTSGTYQWASTSPNGYCDVFGWVSTSSTAYNTANSNYPLSGSYITYNDDGGGNGQFLCSFSATAGTTYYLYASPYSQTTNTSGFTITLQVKQATPLWSVYGYSLASSTTASATRTYTAGQIYRYSWVCPTTGTYEWKGSAMNINCTAWASTASNAYNLYVAQYPHNGTSYLQSNTSTEFSCVFSATAGTTYYLYTCGYTNTTASTTTQTQTVRQVYWQKYWYGAFLNNGLSFATTLYGQTISQYSFVPPASGTYTFEASGCTTDTVGWISTSFTAYNLAQTSNSRSYGTWSDDDTNGNAQFKVTADLIGGTTYYLYFSPYSTSTLAFNNTRSITLTIKATSIVSTGSLITSSQISAFKTIWDGLCTGRKNYGNLNNSTAKGAVTAPSRGVKITSTNMNSILNAYNKYFTPTVTTVNTGNLIQETTYDTLVTRAMSNPSCKVACTGFCSSTNSGAAQPATCSSCDTGCSSSCYGSCSSTCYARCSTGCKGACAWYCEGDCWDSCKDDCWGTCNWDCTGYEGWWPSRDCGSYCNSNCGSTCGGACWNGCYSCSGSCQFGCWDSCEMWCNWDCSGGCSGGCDSSCSGYCDYTCSATCAGGTSGSAGSCNNSCTHSCATSCSTLCVTSSS